MGRQDFDPHVILAALERNYVDYVLIGGVARVLRGTAEVTDGVDICPSCRASNLEHLMTALADLGVNGRLRRQVVHRLLTDPLVSVPTRDGQLKLVASPAGAPNGFVDLRRAASAEDLGGGLRPLVASTGDLARMLAALGRDDDRARVRELRRITELEVDRQRALAPPARFERDRMLRTARTPRTSR